MHINFYFAMKIFLNKKIQNECDFRFNTNTKKFSRHFFQFKQILIPWQYRHIDIKL